jgi:hypothetical protein
MIERKGSVCQPSTVCFEFMGNKQWQRLISCGRNKLKFVLFSGILSLNQLGDLLIALITVRLQRVGDTLGRFPYAI